MAIDAETMRRMKKRARIYNDLRLLLGTTVGAAILIVLLAISLIGKSLTLARIATFASLALSILQVIVFFRLSESADNYRTAAICGIVALVLGVLTIVVPTLSSVIEIVSLILGFVTAYSEMSGHESILLREKSKLADKWRSLWLWFVWTNVIMTALLLIAYFAAQNTFFTVTVIAYAICSITFAVIRLFYLSRTIKVFEN